MMVSEWVTNKTRAIKPRGNMMNDIDKNIDEKPVKRVLSDAAKRALAEAKARQDQIDAVTNDNASEKNGRGGLDPARYGDWEVKGITSDF